MADAKATFSAKGLQPGDRVGPFVLVELIRGQTNRGPGWYSYTWILRCECGRERKTVASNLKRYVGWTKCRCVSPTATHGLSHTSEYISWRGMLNRCYKPTEDAYRFYGAIGHYVCKRWRESFEAFYADMGLRPSTNHSIDRIDTLKHYTCGKCDECQEKSEPANCRWATKAEQVHNQKNNLWFMHNGKTKILKDWCRDAGLTYRVVHSRIYRFGWTFEKAITTPIVKCPKNQLITFRGESMVMDEWTKRLGLSRNAIRQRLAKYGWSIEQALTTPRLASANHQET